MKIVINGDIIDTKDVWKISKISSSDIDRYGFTIYFFNHKEIDVILSGYEVWVKENGIKLGSVFNIKGGYYTTKNYDSYKEKAIQFLEKFRNEVIKYWNEDKKEIPIIELL